MGFFIFPSSRLHLIYSSNSCLIAFIINQSTSPFSDIEDMKASFFCFLLALQMVSWCCARSRNVGFGVHQPGQRTESLQVSLGPSLSSKEMGGATMKKTNGEVDSKLGLGSSPPSCERKCYGCNPCEAIQVPTTSRRGHVGLQYTNYEPESWKCKCGPSFYSP